MKRLLLTLSLICFSWGAGANDFGLETGVVFKGTTDFVPINNCLEAAQDGFELSNRTFENSLDDPWGEFISFTSQREYLYENDIYLLSTIHRRESANTEVMCRIKTLDLKK